MPYPEKLHQKHLNAIMDRLHVPTKDDYGKKLSFTGRVDLLVEYCEQLKGSLKDVLDVAFRTTPTDDKDWSVLEHGNRLVQQQ